MKEDSKLEGSIMSVSEQKAFLAGKFPGTKIEDAPNGQDTSIIFDSGVRLEIHWASLGERRDLSVSVFSPLPPEIVKVIGGHDDIYLSLPVDDDLLEAIRDVFGGSDSKAKSFLENHDWSTGLRGDRRVNQIYDLWIAKAKQHLPRSLHPYLEEKGRAQLVDELMGEKPKVKGLNKNLLERLGIKDVPGLVRSIQEQK